ncbi:glycosyltransferase LafA [Bacillus sp. JCM 19047]|uniref:glycosyltransferase family 4 protein n=1 Tax=Shouchella miscanthi TaxID=2598861 RepID=UPI0003F00114|nr:glycosyltransferase family 4 protein [Shouchella miscanthi]GAF22064.1 glycosyltransferase LafA [Bacillus sp. JCM 19047]
MNIGIFTDTYFPQISGVATSIATLDRELTARGHNVFIFTSEDKQAQVEIESGKIFRFPSLSTTIIPERHLAYRGMRRASKLIKLYDIDLIHTHTEFTMGYLGKYMAYKHKLPFLHTYHTMYEDYLHYVARGKLLTPKMVGWMTKWFCHKADRVIAPTVKVKRTLHRYNVQSPIGVIPTGINVNRFKRTAESMFQAAILRKKLNILPEDRVIVSVGRLAEEKNIDALIHAVHHSKKGHSSIKLILVGEGPHKASLKKLTKTLAVEDNVQFIGAVCWEDVHIYYQLCDLFVSASTTEAQGLTYFEAMAAGCVVVAKADPSIQHAIVHKETGYIFEKDDDLAPLLDTIFQQKQEQVAVQVKSSQFVESLSAEVFGKKIEAIYRTHLLANTLEQSTHKKAISALYRMRRSS